MASRPYINYSYYELRDLAEAHWDSLELLKPINHELTKRRTDYAVHLRKQVNKRISQLETDRQLQIELQERLQQLSQSIADLFESTTSLAHFPTSEVIDIPFLRPDETVGERWITLLDLVQIVNQLKQANISSNPFELVKYGYERSAEINRTRCYQVPAYGNAEVLATNRLKELITLRKIRFVQEGIDTPGVFLRFSFGEPAKIGIVKVSEKMALEGFYEFIKHDLFQAIVKAVTLAYYRDLVTADSSRQARTRQFQRGRRQFSSSPSPQPRELPRPRYISGNQPPLDEWRQIQERQRHRIIGHIRWVSENFVADDERQRLAIKALGWPLADGYTWVKSHERGKNSAGIIEVRQTDLMERTLFLPPRKASRELDELLR